MEQHIVVYLWGFVCDTMKASELICEVLLASLHCAPVVHVYETGWSCLLELFLCCSQTLVKLIVRVFVGHDGGGVLHAATLTPRLSHSLSKRRGLLHARL